MFLRPNITTHKLVGSKRARPTQSSSLWIVNEQLDTKSEKASVDIGRIKRCSGFHAIINVQITVMCVVYRYRRRVFPLDKIGDYFSNGLDNVHRSLRCPTGTRLEDIFFATPKTFSVINPDAGVSNTRT